MSETQNKRKGGPGGQDGSAPKKRQGGSGGKWQTPKHKERIAGRLALGTSFAVGDEGFWATYQKGMKNKAYRELRALCDEYGESLFGIKPLNQEAEENSEDGDIEASIERELESIKSRKPASRQTFTLLNPGIECVVFVKTMQPVDPVQLVLKVCQDAKACTDIMKRKTKYINRLTPVSTTNRATEADIELLASKVLAPWFKLRREPAEAKEGADNAGTTSQRPEDAPLYTYAIRHSIRSHTSFNRDSLINKVANIISTDHKVQLKQPDKVVLVEVFRTFCGMSVVNGSDYEEYKKFNVHEMYRSGTQASPYKATQDSEKPGTEETAEKEAN